MFSNMRLTQSPIAPELETDLGAPPPPANDAGVPWTLTPLRVAPVHFGSRGEARNARWRGELAAGLRIVPAQESRVASVGRPWLGRPDAGCAFIVAGESWQALSCGAAGRARRWGHACYCPPHAAEIYRPKTKGGAA